MHIPCEILAEVEKVNAKAVKLKAEYYETQEGTGYPHVLGSSHDIKHHSLNLIIFSLKVLKGLENDNMPWKNNLSFQVKKNILY